MYNFLYLYQQRNKQTLKTKQMKNETITAKANQREIAPKTCPAGPQNTHLCGDIYEARANSNKTLLPLLLMLLYYCATATILLLLVQRLHTSTMKYCHHYYRY